MPSCCALRAGDPGERVAGRRRYRWTRSRDDRDDVQFLLIGDGPAYEEMSQEDLPITCACWVSPERNDYYAASDMGILPRPSGRKLAEHH